MFYGEKVYLTTYEKDDIIQLPSFINDYEVQRYLAPKQVRLFTIDDELDWHEENRKNQANRYVFAIKTIDGNHHIGNCGYMNTDMRSRHCYIGIMIGNKTFQNKGMGSEAINLLLEYLFLEMNMRKVLLNVYDFNLRAIKVYQRLGFKEEGRLKEQIFRDGKYNDEIIMAIFNKDYIS